MTTPTPTPVPPGLSLPQDFPPLVAPSAPPPAPPRLQRKPPSSTTIKPVVPVLPTPSARSTGIPKETQPEEQSSASEQPSAAPNPLTAGTSAEIGLSKEAIPKTDAAPASSKESKEKNTLVPSKTANKKQRPGKLDITAAKDTSKKVAEPGDVSIENSNAAPKAKGEGASGFGLSQPSTPETVASQASVPSAVRQNRLKTTSAPSLPKAEASSPGMPTNPSKQASRRPSVTSVHRPDTPASERVSDTISFTSTSLSRANSPPPSIVGSAPVRQVTKNQRKRQARAEQAEQAEGSAKAEEPAIKVEEVQAPIIGRKKKTKKERTQDTADSTPTVTRPTSPVVKDEVAEEKATAVPVTPVKNGRKGMYRVAAEVKESDTPSSPATPATGEQQRAPLTAANIIQSMLEAGEVTGAARDIFNPVPGLNHRFETLDSDFADDNESLVSDDQHRLLEQGEAIQIEKGPNNHMVMFPDRRALQGLTAAQASRYLELRKQALVYGDVPSHQALDGLIPPPPPVNVATVSSIPQRGSRQKKLSNKFHLPTVQPEAAGMRKYGGVLAYGDETLTNRKPTMSLAEAERELLVSKKETEALEKKLNALLKKNRRLLFGNAH